MFDKLVLEKTCWKLPFGIEGLVSVLGEKQYFPSAQTGEVPSWKKRGLGRFMFLLQNSRISISRACSMGCEWSTKISRRFLYKVEMHRLICKYCSLSDLITKRLGLKYK